MKLTKELSGKHLQTYKAIFQHPISHNLEWKEVHTLLAQLGEVEDESNGNVKATRNGQVLILHPPHHKDVPEMDDVMKIRHFLERSETPGAEHFAPGPQFLLVIDHHEARLFKSEASGTVPEKILPPHPVVFFRHAQDSVNDSRGKERPNPESYFGPIAKALQSAAEILVFGTGTGMSSEMQQFSDWIKKHHHELAGKIVGCVKVDEHHLSDAQLLAKARDFFASRLTQPNEAKAT